MPALRPPENSPQAAGRVLAMMLLADGEVCDAECRMLMTLEAAATLGLEAPAWQAVMDGFAQDMAASKAPRWAHACQVDPWLMTSVFDAVTDVALRRRVLRLCAVLVEADDRIDTSESVVLNAAVEHWGLQSEMIHSEPA